MAATRQKPEKTFAVTVTRLINAPREEVYAAWSDTEQAKKWSAPEGLTCPSYESDDRVGGRYRLEMHGPDGDTYIATGVYRVVDPPSKLVYTWRWESDPELETLVTVLFKEKGKKTELTVIHEGLPTESHQKDHEQGWSESIDKFVAQFFDGR